MPFTPAHVKACCSQNIQQPFHFWHFFWFSSRCLWHWKHKWINAQLRSCVRAPCPCWWVSANKATQCPESRGQRWGHHQQCCGCSLAQGWLFCCGLAAAFSASQGCTPWAFGPFLILCIHFGSRYSFCRHKSWMNAIFFILNKTTAMFYHPFLSVSQIGFLKFTWVTHLHKPHWLH